MLSSPEPDSASVDGLPLPGTCLDDKYVIESVLGMGGMGAVLLATDRTLGQQVAIKVLLPKVAGDPVMLGRFVREAQAAAAIQSDHVVRIFGLGKTAAGLPFIVMERLTGVGLDEVSAAHGPLPIPYVADVILEVCRALAHAHALGIIHRDLKPSNLFVSRQPDGSERVKILDFGISKADGLLDNPQLTGTMQVMGTPVYMSPEQARSTKHVDTRSDLWSLGVVCYELACGTTPFAADTAAGIIARIVADQPVRPRALRPELPEQLERLILWCIEKDPSRRPQTVAAMVPFLRPFASARGLAAADSLLRTQDSGLLNTAVRLDPIHLVAARSAGASGRGLSLKLAGLGIAGLAMGTAAYLLMARGAGPHESFSPAESSSAAPSASAREITSSAAVTPPGSQSGVFPVASTPPAAFPSAAPSGSAPPRRSPPITPGADPFDRF